VVIVVVIVVAVAKIMFLRDLMMSVAVMEAK
jgi:hypothetical protein